MTARIEALKAPRQVSPWFVIGVAAALIAGLAVLTIQQELAVTPTARPAVTVARTSDVVEMAALKSAVATRYIAERFGTSVNASTLNEDALETAVKARLAHGYVETGSASRSADTKIGHPANRKS